MNRIRSQSHQDSGQTVHEVDLFEQAIEESKMLNDGSWKDLFSKTYGKRTIVSALGQACRFFLGS